MAEIELTLPTVTYGNVKVRATPEELGIDGVQEARALGTAAAVYINLFTQGFKAGAQIDVSAPVSASQEAPEEKAQELLNEGLGGVTELSEGTPEAAKPWGQKVDAKKKPWETGEVATEAAIAPVVLDSSW